MCSDSKLLSSNDIRKEPSFSTTRESLSSEEDIKKETRICHTREFLMSLSELNVCKNLPDDFDRSILSELNDTYYRPPEHHKSRRIESAPVPGQMTGSSGKNEPEKWSRWRLRSKDSSSSTDLEGQDGNRTQHSWQSSEGVASWGNSSPELNGISGKWRHSKSSEGGSEASTIESQGPENSLLSKCNEPYRPPGFYQATYQGRQNQDSCNTETSGIADVPMKERASEETRRTTSIESSKNDQINAPKQKHNSSFEDQKENSKESSYADFKTTEKHLSEGSSSNHSQNSQEELPSENQLMMQEETNFEFFPEVIFKGGLLATLLASEYEENANPSEVLFAATDNCRDCQNVTATDANFDILKKEVPETRVGPFYERKEIEINDIVSINSMEMTDADFAEVEDSVISGSMDKSSQTTSNSSLDIDLEIELFQSLECIELYNRIVEGRDGCRSQFKFIPWITDKATNNVQYNVSSSSFRRNDQINKKTAESSTRILMNENTIEGLSKEQTLHDQTADFSDSNRSRTFIRSSSFSYMSSTQNSDSPVESQLNDKGKKVIDESSSFPYMSSKNFHPFIELQIDKHDANEHLTESNSFPYTSSQIIHSSLRCQLDKYNANQVIQNSSLPYMPSQNSQHSLQAQLNRSNGNQVLESSIPYMSSQNFCRSRDPQLYKLYGNQVSATSSIPYMSNPNIQHARQPQLGELHGNHIGSAFGAVSQSIQYSNVNPSVSQIEDPDSDIGINLPEEDSLITLDETYITNTTPSNNSTQRAGNLSYVSSTNNMLAPGTLQQYLNWKTWLLQQSQMNSQPTFTNISDPRVYSPTFQNTLIAYQNPHNIAANAHTFTQFPTETRRFEPSIQQFASPGVQSAERFALYYCNPVSPQPVIQPHTHPIQYLQLEQVPSVHLPITYQNHVDAGNIGTFRTQEVNMAHLSQLLQIMQMRLGR